MTEPLFISDAKALTELCESLRGSPWLALDTEFIREKTYYPQLCLVQVADAEIIACIDPLALDNLDPLLDLLYDPAITKVLHAASQDLEIFHYLRGTLPTPLFDTQIAATLLGQGEQIGYAALVQTLLGVELDKSQTRTDWSQRPLDKKQLTYAADDVRHLREVYQHQRDDLEKRGRLDWLSEDFAALGQPERYQNHPEQAWLRLKGAGKLRGVQLAVLRALAAWREHEAMRADRPRRWILSDQVVFDLARTMPKRAAEFAKLRGLESKTIKRHGEVLLATIAKAAQEPPEQWPRISHVDALSLAQEALVDALLAVVKISAHEHQVSPGSLANRKDIERLVRGDNDIEFMHGWRKTLVGDQIAGLLRNESRLEVKDKVLRLTLPKRRC